MLTNGSTTRGNRSFRRSVPGLLACHARQCGGMFRGRQREHSAARGVPRFEPENLAWRLSWPMAVRTALHLRRQPYFIMKKNIIIAGLACSNLILLAALIYVCMAWSAPQPPSV